MTCPYCSRSQDEHNFHFAAINAAFHHWPEWHPFQPLSVEHLRGWLYVEAGYVNAIDIDDIDAIIESGDDDVLWVDGNDLSPLLRRTPLDVGPVLADHLWPDKAVEKIGAAGRPVLHTQIRIVDTGGNVCGPGAVGELQIKGPTVTPGYWNKPDANAASFVDGGWFRTGDAAVCDADGYYTIVDRWKDMYISGGENVYPAEIEVVDVAFKK